MNKAAFLFLILIPSILHCSEEEQGLIDLKDQSSIEIPIVLNQDNRPVTKKSKKMAKRTLFLAFVPLVIGVCIDIHTAETYSTEFRQVATAFPLNATDAQLAEASCQSYRCFCDYGTECVCCSNVFFPDYDKGMDSCQELLDNPEDEQYPGVFIKRCEEMETKKTPIILSSASGVCRFVTNFLLQGIANRLGMWK